jgi:hypothetical protein
VSIGEKVDNTYVAYDDIKQEYKAEHPKSRQQGFNAKAIKNFYADKIGAILYIKDIVDEGIEAENRAKAKARQEQAKLKRQTEKRLQSYGGIV